MDTTPEVARSFRYAEMQTGMREQKDYVISPEVYHQFLGAFGDHSPIHVDEDYAKQHGFPGRVMHGTLLSGFLSHFVGMYFPGERSLLLATDLRFGQPCFLADVIRLDATVSQKMDAKTIVVLDLLFTNVTRNVPAARGRAQVMMRES